MHCCSAAPLYHRGLWSDRTWCAELSAISDLIVWAAQVGAGEGSNFNWDRQWYPLAVADQLDPGRPNKASLLGRPLALWRDPEGVWRAFEDRCPHRLAPFTGKGIAPDIL